jgi:hypothetical protein
VPFVGGIVAYMLLRHQLRKRRGDTALPVSSEA